MGFGRGHVTAETRKGSAAQSQTKEKPRARTWVQALAFSTCTSYQPKRLSKLEASNGCRHRELAPSVRWDLGCSSSETSSQGKTQVAD